MNEEEKKVVNIFIEKCNKYDESVEIKGISVDEEYRILTTVCKALDLAEKLQKENEKYKRLSEMNLKNAEEFKNNMCEHRCLLKSENKELKEYIAIAPNLDEMTATKYRNIRQDAYIQGRAEEQQKAEQIIHENYISKQKIKDKIEELNQYYKKEIYPILYQWSDVTITEHYDEMIELLQELLGKGDE